MRQFIQETGSTLASIQASLAEIAEQLNFKVQSIEAKIDTKPDNKLDLQHEINTKKINLPHPTPLQETRRITSVSMILRSRNIKITKANDTVRAVYIGNLARRSSV